MPNSSVTDVILEKISSHLGASAETLQKVRFGRGTVGKVAIIAVFALGAISVGTYRLTGNAAIIGISAMVLVTLAVLGLILYIVIVRPELAVLEGTELVLYKQITLGAKDMLPPAENVSSIAGPVALATKADEKPEAGKE